MMDYYELMSSKTKENIEGISHDLEHILRTMEDRSRFRYEFLIKILIEKRIIDTDDEVLRFIQNEKWVTAKELVHKLPDLDINGSNSRMFDFKKDFENDIKSINSTWEYEVQSLLERLERLEEKTDFFREKEESS